eukprot:TRINITY_DN4655_c0_g2_i1.p1 TRINITY_DN4655_c0_g2~~TRINITY_DN4655_c0_g2_i1.p1  ORF type:complete len:855 (-),score=165.24 TRINITY_DN4655_c0_g2_i1:85-2649(-)
MSSNNIDPNGKIESPNSGSSMSIPSIYQYREINYDEIKLDPIPIGSGAFGVVYRGVWRGAVVAVKQLQVSFGMSSAAASSNASNSPQNSLSASLLAEEESLRDEIRREATMIDRVANHPNIIRFYGACTKKSPYCLVTELYPKGSVSTLFRAGVELSWKVIVGFARDAAAGIMHLHSEELIHRDIAARNLLVDEQWVVRISDFGLSRIKTKAVSQTKSNIGPIRSMSPESLKSKQYSTASDSYSFGILMWELLEKKEPYEDLEPINIAIGVLHEGLRPPISPTTPKVYADLMEKCWNADPKLRPTFSEIFEILQEYYFTLEDPALQTTNVFARSLNISNTNNNVNNNNATNYNSASPLTYSATLQNSSSSAVKFGQELECPICCEVFEIVTEVPCCHNCYCKSCIVEWIEKKKQCPHCNSPLEVKGLTPNVPFQRIVDNLGAVCPGKSSGCNDHITRGCLQDHLSKCPFILVQCTNSTSDLPNAPPPCGKFLRKDLATHQSTTCPFRRVPCPEGCNEQVVFWNIEGHFSTCTHASIDCVNGCGAKVPRKDMGQHVNEVCTHQAVPCKYAKWGCDATVLRGEVERHMNSSVQIHLQLAETMVNSKSSNLEKRKKKKEALYMKIANLGEQIVQLRTSLDQLMELKPKLPYHPLNNKPYILPSHFILPETSDVASNLQLEQDLLTLSYKKEHGIFSSVSSASSKFLKAFLIFTDRPIPPNCSYYFEISVKNLGRDSAIGIGFSKKFPAYDIALMPGWKPGSFGYHGDDGKKFGPGYHDFGREYGPVWNKDDVIGCGIDTNTSTIFYTQNGRYLGVAFDHVDRNFDYYPAVGLHSRECKIKGNFGLEPFAFDIPIKPM